VRISLANQPQSTQSFGSSFEMPTILVNNGWKWQVMVTATLVTEDGKPHPHKLEGPNCKQGVFFYQAGQEDPFKKLKHEALKHNVELREGQYRSDEQIRKNNWNITKAYGKSILMMRRNHGQDQLIQLPPLKIKPTIKENQRTALREREQFSKKNPIWWGQALWDHSKFPPFGDPFAQGFGHKNDDIDLSAVKIAFFVTVNCTGWVTDKVFNRYSTLCSDVIFDGTPRILEFSGNEGAPEGGSLLSLLVNRDDVAVEFLDKKGWSVVLEIPELEPPDSNAPDPEALIQRLIQRIREEQQTTYVARIEVETPAFHTISASREKAFVRLVSKDQREKSEPIPFTYLPSEAPPPPSKEEEVASDYISTMLGEKNKADTPDYLAMVKKEAEKAPVVKQVLRPVRQERVIKELPKHLTNEEHKKAAQNQIMDKFFKK